MPDDSGADVPDLSEPGFAGGKPAETETGPSAHEHVLDPARRALHGTEHRLEPAWRRVTVGEPRLPVSLAVLAAIAIEFVLPSRVANHPRAVLAGVAAALLVGIVAANPRRINKPERRLRAASLVLIGVLSAANMASAARLITDLVNGEGIRDPAQLLLTGAAIWLTNIIVFSLWYWEFDRGGPAARANATQPYPDFLFPQMTSPDLAPPEWEPVFLDYLYMSFTNAMAFSPTDVIPMTRWAKLTMLAQSVVSVVTLVLVIARAVNILK